MKKVILVAAVLSMIGITAKAQTQKGWYLIGGTIGNLGGTFQGGGSKFNFNLSPKAAWFIKDNLAIGGQVALDLKTAKGAGTTLGYSIGPLARYYFGKDQMSDVNIESPKNVRFFAEANAGFGGENNSKAGGSTNGFVAGAGPGVAFFVNENIALEALAKFDIKTGFGNSTVAFSPNIGVGFQIYLPGSKLKAMKNDMK